MKKTLFLLLFITFGLMYTSVKINATEFGQTLITDVQLQDKHGVVTETFETNQTMKVHYDYLIPDDVVIKKDDTMTVQLPEQLVIANSLSFHLADQNGAIVGTAVLDKQTGKIVITFTDYYETHIINRRGSFHVMTTWNHQIVKGNETITIDLGKGGTTVNIVSPKGTIDTDEKIFKYGYILAEDPTTIVWKVRINAERQPIFNAVFTDYIGENQVLVPNSIYVDLGTFDPNGVFTPEMSVSTTQISVADDSKHFTVAYGKLTTSSLITYETKITDDLSSAEYTNFGKLTGENIAEQVVEVYTPNTFGGGNGGGNSLETMTEETTEAPEESSQSISSETTSEEEMNDSQQSSETTKNREQLPLTGTKMNKCIVVLGLVIISISVFLLVKSPSFKDRE